MNMTDNFNVSNINASMRFIIRQRRDSSFVAMTIRKRDVLHGVGLQPIMQACLLQPVVKITDVAMLFAFLCFFLSTR